MLTAALEREVEEYLERQRYVRGLDESAFRGYRNGDGCERQVTIGSGTIKVRAPRVSDTPVEQEPFASKILKPYQRRSQKLAELFPKLFVEGLATRDFEPALRCLLGKSAALSPATIVRLNVLQASIPLLAQETRTDSLRFLRRELTFVLASWGIDRVGDYEVYDAIVAEPLHDHGDYAERMMALAGLQDPRTPAYVEATYDSIRTRPNWDPRFGPSAALNCLYFIPGAKALEVAKKIAAKEKDPALRERAARVITRKNP